MAALNPDTVWTWNAIGKRRGSWNLDSDAAEGEKGFLLNHLISELLPAETGGRRMSNSDPVTGQAGWYDVRVRIYPAAANEPGETWPQFADVFCVPGQCESRSRNKWLKYFAGRMGKAGKKS